MDLASAATTYSREIDQSMGRSKFDLTFLSLGEDGHIASLFPGHCEELADKNSALAVNNSPKPPAKRVSISVNRLAASEAIFIFAIGASKKNALANLLAGPVGLLVKSAPLAQISVITDNKNSLKTEQI